jgi:hypothetical protein
VKRSMQVLDPSEVWPYPSSVSRRAAGNRAAVACAAW